jgi:hypothetical protein
MASKVAVWGHGSYLARGTIISCIRCNRIQLPVPAPKQCKCGSYHFFLREPKARDDAVGGIQHLHYLEMLQEDQRQQSDAASVIDAQVGCGDLAGHASSCSGAASGIEVGGCEDDEIVVGRGDLAGHDDCSDAAHGIDTDGYESCQLEVGCGDLAGHVDCSGAAHGLEVGAGDDVGDVGSGSGSAHESHEERRRRLWLGLSSGNVVGDVGCSGDARNEVGSDNLVGGVGCSGDTRGLEVGGGNLVEDLAGCSAATLGVEAASEMTASRTCSGFEERIDVGSSVAVSDVGCSNAAPDNACSSSSASVVDDSGEHAWVGSWGFVDSWEEHAWGGPASSAYVANAWEEPVLPQTWGTFRESYTSRPKRRMPYANEFRQMRLAKAKMRPPGRPNDTYLH